MKTGMTVGLSMLLALTFGCSRGQAPADSAVGRKVAEAFLGQLREGQVDSAWQSTTAEFKSDEGRESFARFVKRHPFLKQPLNFVEHRVGDINGLTRGQCIYQRPPEAKAAAIQTVRIAVAHESGEWKVDGIFAE